MNPLFVAFLLWQYGHTPVIEGITALAKWAMSGGLSEALKSFQAFHGLEPTGQIDARTVEQLSRPRCAHPDVRHDRATPCHWPEPQITFAQVVKLTQIAPDRVAAIYRQAWQQWADVCGIEPHEATPADVVNVLARNADGTANGFDANNTILAWSELPCNASMRTQLQQEFNDLVDWTEQMLLGVACHEIGHALGFDHISGDALMNAYYDANRLKPLAKDIAVAQEAYGPPKAAPAPASAPAPAPAPPAKLPGTITVRVPVSQAGTYLLDLSMHLET